MVTTFTYKPSLVKIDARNFELQTNAHTDRTLIQYTVKQSIAGLNVNLFVILRIYRTDIIPDHGFLFVFLCSRVLFGSSSVLF